MAAKKTTKRVISENRENSLKFYAGLVAVALVVGFGTIHVGKSDGGAIDVNATIDAANQVRTESGDDSAQVISTVREIHKKLPNGGLVPAANQETQKKPEPKPEPTETASSTEEVDDSEEDTEEGADSEIADETSEDSVTE